MSDYTPVICPECRHENHPVCSDCGAKLGQCSSEDSDDGELGRSQPLYMR